MATAKIPVRLKGQTTCVHHKRRQFELYCEKCQQLVCSICVSSIHKGHLFCQLSEIIDPKKQEIRKFIHRTERNELVQIGIYIVSSDALLDDNEKYFDKLAKQLSSQTETLKQNLDKITADTIYVYQKMKEDNAKLIHKYRQDLEVYEQHLTLQIKDCKLALQKGSDLEVYDTECEIDTRIHLPIEPMLSSISFTPNKNPQHYLDLALGKSTTLDKKQTLDVRNKKVSPSDGRGESPPKKEHRKEPESTREILPKTRVLREWKAPYYITSLCPIAIDKVWICNSSTLTLLDRIGNVLMQDKHNRCIKDISVSPKTHRLWACDIENNILERTSGKFTEAFKTNNTPICICVSANKHIIVGVSKDILKYTPEGQVELNAMNARTCKPLICSPYRITECPITSNVAVIDHNHTSDGGDGNRKVVVMDTCFQELFVYKGDIPGTNTASNLTDKFYPKCISYDSLGNIIIGDRGSFRFLLLSGGGDVKRILDNNINMPLAVGIDRDGVLWVASGWFRRSNVKLLQYLSKK